MPECPPRWCGPWVDRVCVDCGARKCWRNECRNGCYYSDVCSERRPTE